MCIKQGNNAPKVSVCTDISIVRISEAYVGVVCAKSRNIALKKKARPFEPRMSLLRPHLTKLAL
jgi:hypothetical protein